MFDINFDEYREYAVILEIRDLGPAQRRSHTRQPLCLNSPLRYGIRHNGTIVEWCPECGRINNAAGLCICPNCKSKINPKDPADRHLKKVGNKLRIVCP